MSNLVAKFVAMGVKNEMEKLKEGLGENCKTDLISLEDISPTDWVVLFRYDFKGKDYYKCYGRDSLREWFSYHNTTLPDSRNPVSEADIARVLDEPAPRTPSARRTPVSSRLTPISPLAPISPFVPPPPLTPPPSASPSARLPQAYSQRRDRPSRRRTMNHVQMQRLIEENRNWEE